VRVEILKLLGNGGFVSGEYIAEHLGVSRTAVWKQIKSLQNMGYEIESVKNKGYRLVSRPDIPIAEEVTLGLDTQVIGKDIYYFKSLPSTNLFAKKLVKDGVKEGAIVVSYVQLNGRGRKSRNWFSPEGGCGFRLCYIHTSLQSVACCLQWQVLLQLFKVSKRQLAYIQ